MHGRGLGWAGLVEQLQPVIQAAKLLQMKKSSVSDAAAIIELCTHLNPLQVSCKCTQCTSGRAFLPEGTIDPPQNSPVLTEDLQYIYSKP